MLIFILGCAWGTIMMSRRPCFHSFSRTVSYSSFYCFVGITVVRGKYTLLLCQYCDSGNYQKWSLQRTFNKFMRCLTMCAMLNNFAIFSDDICYEWTNFIKWIPENKIKFFLPELYNIAKSDSMSSTDNPESP